MDWSSHVPNELDIENTQTFLIVLELESKEKLLEIKISYSTRTGKKYIRTTQINIVLIRF